MKVNIEYTKNNIAHDRTKHIEIEYHLVPEQIHPGNITLAKVRFGDLFYGL